MKKIETYRVSEDAPIRTAIKQMDDGGIGLIVCVDKEGNVVGIVTDGDFRRAILKGVDLENKVGKIANRKFYYLQSDYKDYQTRDIFQKTVARHIPILKNKKLVDILTENSLSKRQK